MLIALGIVTGILGFLPLFLSLRLSRRSTSTHATIGLYGVAGVAISLVILVAGLIACAIFCIATRLVGFVVAEGIVFLGCTIAFVCTKNVLAKRKRV